MYISSALTGPNGQGIIGWFVVLQSSVKRKLVVENSKTVRPQPREIIGRFAPSPTGPLHFGSLLVAVGSFCLARRQHGRWLLRIEDLDTPRVVDGAADDILRTLETLGLYWDGEVVYQSRRSEAYPGAGAAAGERNPFSLRLFAQGDPGKRPASGGRRADLSRYLPQRPSSRAPGARCKAACAAGAFLFSGWGVWRDAAVSGNRGGGFCLAAR